MIEVDKSTDEIDFYKGLSDKCKNVYLTAELPVVINNHKQFIQECRFLHKKYKYIFPDGDSTFSHNFYNLIQLAPRSDMWHDFFTDVGRQVKQYVKEHTGHDKLWLKMWINFHRPNKVLTKHGHMFPWHGYVSIDPKETQTVFDNWTIDNKVGQLYIGSGYNEHEVRVLEDYEGHRITIAFDVLPNNGGIIRYQDCGFVPI